MPSRWAALRGRYYVHLVQMHGPFPNLVRVGVPLFGGLSATARRTTRATGRPSERDTHFDNETTGLTMSETRVAARVVIALCACATTPPVGPRPCDAARAAGERKSCSSSAAHRQVRMLTS